MIEVVFKTKDRWDYGGLDWKGEIEINIELLWDDCNPDEDKFIKGFSKTYTHELLHIEIDEVIGTLYYLKEEEIIRKILGEEWDDELLEEYKEEAMK